MSLILEALRKSEAERRSGDAPGLAVELPPVAAPARRRLPAAAWLAAAVLVAAAILVLAWPDAPDADVEPAASSAPAPPVAAPAGPPEGLASAQLPPVDRIRPQPAPRPDPAPDRPLAPPPMATRAADEAAETPVAAAPANAPTPSPPPSPSPSRAAAPAQPLRISSLPEGQRQRLPEMKLSLHMWNEDPARRFAVIDGQRRVEGDRIGDATITAIDRDGVLLDLDGQAVRVPLP